MIEIENTVLETKCKKTSDMIENFKKGVLIISMLFLLVAALQLYFSIGSNNKYVV